jgi:putative ABC transport system permease protein
MGMWSRIRKTFRGGRHSAEIQEELQFHLDMDAAGGHDRRHTRLRLGNVTRIEEETRAMGIVEWLDSALRDARYGLRQLRKSPALVLAVVLSLTIGVGANTAIFSLVDAAILKPLPVKHADSLLIVEWTNDGFPEGATNINGDFGHGSGGRVQGSSVGANLYRSLARHQTGFEALMGIADPDSVSIAVDASPADQASLQYVSSNFFQGLGVLPVIGRAFQDQEDRVGQEPVVIVSHRLWMSRLGGAREALDRNIRINNVPARIVGVAPPGFFGLRAGQWTDVYAPLAMRVAFREDRSEGTPRGEDDSDWWIRQVGRPKPGVTEAAARSQIAGLFRTLVVPEGTKIEPKKIPELITLPGRRGFDALNARDTSALWILMVLVGVLLLIVCANVANLLLSRSVGRQRESAVRLALGASRTRLFRQHLIESGVLALLGGAAGLALGYVLAQSIHLLFQSGRDASNAFDLHLDPRVLGYTGALSILTALLFGLAPAVRAAHADLSDALKAQARSVMGGRMRLPRLLVAFQIALCLTALVAAGLLGRSLENLKWIDVGFDRENLAYASVNPWQAGYSAERVGSYADRVREQLARLPGVLRVSTVQVRLLSGNGNISRVNIPGRQIRIQKGIVNESDAVQRNGVGDGFFETLRIPLVAGRTIERRDIRPSAEAVVVDELFARRFFPNQNPLGRRFGLNQKANNRYEIVGVARDSRYNSLRNAARPTVYEPVLPAENGRGPIHFAIRTSMDSARLAEAVRKVVASVDPAVPLTEFHTQTALIDRLLRTERLLGFVSGAFGLVALTLAAIGLGGLLAYAVARRTNEIGVRMALGAAAGDVIRMVLRDSLWMVGIGVLIGLPCAYAIGRVLKTALFRLEPLDPWTATLSFFALLMVALLAAWLPARRAARIDPMTALREE